VAGGGRERGRQDGKHTKKEGGRGGNRGEARDREEGENATGKVGWAAGTGANREGRRMGKG
jgi:hypothetical protein